MRPDLYFYFAFIAIFLSLGETKLVDENDPVVQVWCDEAVLNNIVSKLNELDRKIDLLDMKLTTTIATTEKKPVNIEQIIANSVKDYHTQLILETINQNVKEIQQNQKDMSIQVGKLNHTIISEGQNMFSKEIKKNQSYELLLPDLILDKLLYAQKESKQYLESFTERFSARIQEKLLMLKNDIKHFITSNFVENKQDVRENQRQILLIKTQMFQGFSKQQENQNLLQKQLLTYIDNNLKKFKCNLTKSDLTIEIDSLNSKLSNFNSTLNIVKNFMVPSFENCVNALESTDTSDVYRLFMPQSGLAPFDAYCLKDQNNIGWTIIQRRKDGSVNFYRNWIAYRLGFGDPEGEYWIGLEKIFAMTSKRPHELWIKLVDFQNETRNARYALFEIGNVSEGYYLKTIGTYSGDAGNSLGWANKTRKFTTYDADNDDDKTRNCAIRFSGAWWYNTCNWSDLNAQYNNTENGKGINWYQWHGYEYSMKYVHMAIRPIK